MEKASSRPRWFHFADASPSVFLLIIVLLCSTAGCGESATEVPDQLILYSIDGRDDRKTSPGDELLHGYPVLGKLDIQESPARTMIMDALNDGMSRSDGTMNKCFWPRHAIHTVQKRKTIDYVICFECLQLAIYQDSGETTKATTRAPQAVFNEYLTKAGIPLAPD